MQTRKGEVGKFEKRCPHSLAGSRAPLPETTAAGSGRKSGAGERREYICFIC